MRKVQILTDSCADMPRELREKYGVDYGRMRTVYKGEETEASTDFEYYTPQELYGKMRNGERVTTTQVPPEEFERIFRLYLDQGMDIVYIGCSLLQSSSVNTGAVIAKKMMEEYPGSTVISVNSSNASIGIAMLCMKAAEYRDAGMTAQEIADKIVGIRKTVREYVTVHTLDYLARAGRLKASKAFLGNLFGVKPIIISDVDGAQASYKKVKGRLTSLQEIVNLTKESIVDAENQTIYIVHADCAEDAETLRNLVKENIPCKDVWVGYIGPIIGASVGPDAIGIYSFGETVTFGG